MNYTQLFQKKRDEALYKQALVLSMPTITKVEDIKPLRDAMQQMKELKSNPNAQEKWKDLALKSSAELKKTNLASKGLNERNEQVETVEKTFENFWGAVAAQSLSAHADFIAGQPNGLTQMRLSKQLANGESQGYVDGTIDSILVTNNLVGSDIETGWLQIYTTSTAFLDKVSLIVIDAMQMVQGQKLDEMEDIKFTNTLKHRKVQKTKYERYGVAMIYGKFEENISQFLESLGGINGLFSAFRARMAKDKASEAYKKLCMIPSSPKLIHEATELNTELSALASESDKEYYYAKRAVHNIKQAISKMRKESSIADGESEDEEMGEEISGIGTNPLIHVLYNPDAVGSGVIDVIQEVISRPSSRLSFGARVVFHDSSLVPKSGAWKFRYDGKKLLRNSRGFERVQEAGSDLSFGVMIVAVDGSHVYGVNMEYYNMTMQYAQSEAVAYFGFERYTHHVDESRKIWLKNLVPADENQYAVISQ